MRAAKRTQQPSVSADQQPSVSPPINPSTQPLGCARQRRAFVTRGVRTLSGGLLQQRPSDTGPGAGCGGTARVHTNTRSFKIIIIIIVSFIVVVIDAILAATEHTPAEG